MFLSGLLLVAFAAPDEKAITADLIIQDVRIVDGTGQPAQTGDLAFRGDRIVAVGRFAVAGNPRIVDGHRLVAAPGFIDLHTHSDDPLLYLASSVNLNYLMQGVATVVTGNCGTGPYDVAGFYRQVEAARPGSNVAHLVPHNAVRRAVLGNANRLPTETELKRMADLVDRGMRDGAWGLSTGLIYNPGVFAKTEELIVLARVAARHNGFYASHIRDEGVDVVRATEEAITIGREARLPVHISHMKAAGPKAWGRPADTIALVEKARREGQVVTADQYPYTVSSTSLAAMVIPSRFREGEPRQYLARLGDPHLREAIVRDLQERGGAQTLRIARCTAVPRWRGKDLETIAREENKDPADVVLEIERRGGASCLSYCMNEEDVRLIMKRPWVATASDGAAMLPAADTLPHPRSYGCFPRKIARYALADGLLTLEQAIRSASGLAADILRLPERGYLRPGFFADVVIFDPTQFRDTATFDKPQQYATGVRYLFVNGKLAIGDGKFTGVRAGRVLRHKD